MLLWAGVLLLAIGAACLPVDLRVAHVFYDYESAAFAQFVERSTHWAKASHWLIAALVSYGTAQACLAIWGAQPDFQRAANFSIAFLVCLSTGSAILHSLKLVAGRRRPWDDIEMGMHGFNWFKFRLEYNSFPSGHALTIMCVAVIASCVWPHLAILWFGIAIWLGLTRALLTAHFLSDVFIGAGIGMLAARETLLYVFPHLAPAWF
jgi:membrane-associated phospholipid phosphatase